ncbi:MAG: hypothetical protein UY36_C0005G0012 [Parcubacteria group bacterium GW2011_GWA1_49_11]|nr:MAG: hypothetical protein UY36_C0005G0012 [Parcubacteria group bacterium GW2011_GWA1_49_11]
MKKVSSIKYLVSSMKNVFVVVFCLAYLILNTSYIIPVRADTAPPNAKDFSYLFHLYYDNGQLSADRDFQFSYDIIGAPYTAPALATETPYRGEVINFMGEIADHFAFDPKAGDVKFTKGKISVKAPYIADGDKVVFYDSRNLAVLTVNVSGSSFCNDDGVCNDEKGEDSSSCPKDCKQSLPAPPVTPAVTAEGEGGTSLLAGILYALAGLVLFGGLWFFLKRRKNPSPTLPTPPIPPNPQKPL